MDDDAGENGQPPGIPIGAAHGHADDPTEAGGAVVGPAGERSVPGNSTRRSTGSRWLSKRRLSGLGGTLAILLVGVGVLYWAANSGSAKADHAQTGGDRAPISPRVSGPVVRVLVDAREGTVLIDFGTVSRTRRGQYPPLLSNRVATYETRPGR